MLIWPWHPNFSEFCLILYAYRLILVPETSTTLILLCDLWGQIRPASLFFSLAQLNRRFSETKGFFKYIFLFNKRPPKDADRKTEFFAYVISRKGRANQRKKCRAIFVDQKEAHMQKLRQIREKENGPTFDIHLRRLCIHPFNNFFGCK